MSRLDDEMSQILNRRSFKASVTETLESVDPNTALAEMAKVDSLILHTTFGLSYTGVQYGLGLCVTNTFTWTYCSRYQSRKAGFAEFCDELEKSTAFEDLRTTAYRQNLHIGFQPLKIKGHRTVDSDKTYIQPVLTFSKTPLTPKPYSRDYYSDLYNAHDGPGQLMGAYREFDQRNMGPVVKITRLNPPGPSQPNFFAQLMGRGSVEEYHITG